MSIEFLVSIGYRRRRPDITDRIEARMDSLGLMIAGAIVAIIIIWIALPRFLAWLSSL